MQQLLQPMQRVLDTHESAFALLMSRLDGITARLPLAPADAPAVTVVEDGGEVLNVEDAQPAVGHDEENDVVRRPARRSTVRPTIQGSDGRGPTPFIDSLAHGSAPAPSSAEEGDALGEGDEAHDLLDQLEAIGQPAEVSVAELFHAMPLPVPHDEYNPFERSRIFRSQSCHYVPKLGGDSLAQGSYDALLETTRLPGNITVRTGAWAHSYIYELRSIVPALSYLHDLRASTSSAAADLAGAVADGTLPPTLAHLPQTLVDLSVQSDSIYEHLNQRLSIVNNLAMGAETELECLRRLFDRERRMAGQQSRVEQAISDQVVNKTTTALTSISSRRTAQERTFSLQLRSSPIPASGGQPSFRRNPQGRGPAPAATGQRPAQRHSGSPTQGATPRAQPPPSQNPSQLPTASQPTRAPTGKGARGAARGAGGARGGARG